MASLPTITLHRAFEPEELTTESCYTTKHKQPPTQEILFLPIEKSDTTADNMKDSDRTKQGSLYAGGGQKSSYKDISKYKM